MTAGAVGCEAAIFNDRSTKETRIRKVFPMKARKKMAGNCFHQGLKSSFVGTVFLLGFLLGGALLGADAEAVLFKDDFESGRLSKEKWDWKVSPYGGDSKIEIVDVPGRGKVLHIVGEMVASWVSPKVTLGDIPFILEFDADVPEYTGKAKDKMYTRRFILSHKTSEQDRTHGWRVSQQWYCYHFSWPDITKSHYQPNGPGKNRWIRYHLDSDGGIVKYGYYSPDGKLSVLPYPTPNWVDRTGRIFFQAVWKLAYPDWKPPEHPPAPTHHWWEEFWLDNVKIIAKPIAERRAYKKHLSNYERLSSVFSEADYRKAVGPLEPSEMKELGKTLEKVKLLPPADAEAYKEKMKTIARLEKACLDFYRRQEPKVFHLSFKKASTYTPVDLSPFYNDSPERPEPLKGIKPVTEVESVPFRVSPVGPYALHLPMEEVSATQIPLGREAKDIFLLMRLSWQTDFLGKGGYASTDRLMMPVYGGGKRSWTTYNYSEELPVALQVEMRYGDGYSEKVVPERLDGRPFPSRNALLVWRLRPMHPAKISSIIVHKMTNDLECEIFGVTLANGFPQVEKVETKRMRTPEPAKIRPGEPTVTVETSGVTLESPSYRIVIPGRGPFRFKKFINKYSGRNYLLAEPGPMLLTGPFIHGSEYAPLVPDGKGGLAPAPESKEKAHLSCWNIEEAEKLPTGEVSLELSTDDKSLAGKLLISAKPESVSMKLSIENRGEARKDLVVLFPVIKNLALGGYFYPHLMGITSNQPIDFDMIYDGLYGVMMQMMAGWDKEGRSGMSLRVEDVPISLMKSFRLYKPDQKGAEPPRLWSLGKEEKSYTPEDIGPMGKGMAFAVHYFVVPVEPGKTRALPTTTISVYPGTWKEALRRYSDWVHGWWKPLRPTPERLKYAALDVTGGQLGWRTGLAWGGVDFIHLVVCGSADYASEIKKLIPPVAEREKRWRALEPPISHGLYCVEGTYIQTVTKLFKDYAEKGARRDEEGGVSWYQPLDPKQMWMCAARKEWQKYVAETAALWAKGVDPVEVYVDTIGHRFPRLCFAKEHNHYAPDAEAREKPKLVETVTRAVMKANPEVGVMSEGPGSDYTTQFLDGSWVSWRGPDVSANPGRFTFFRFLIPTFKFIQLRGDSVTVSKIAYFNGFPVNIYIYGGYDRTKETLRPLVLAYRDNVDVLTSSDAEVDVPTGAPGIYMNRFGTAGRKKIIYTVANWGKRSWNGALSLDRFEGAHYVDLTRASELKFKPKGNASLVELALDPYEVAYIGVFEKAIKAKMGGYLEVEYLGKKPKDATLGLQIESGSFWIWKRGLPAEERLNLHEVLGRFTVPVGKGARALVKLYSGKDLVDAAGVRLTSER